MISDLKDFHKDGIMCLFYTRIETTVLNFMLAIYLAN